MGRVGGVGGGRTRFIGIAITAVALILAVVFCRSGDRPTPLAGPAATASIRGGQLVASIRSEPRTFNRFIAQDLTTDLIAQLTQGRLIRINRATFEMEPWLAESWESSPDGRTHTLHLRRDVTWSDGVPFTSDDVLFSFTAIFDPKVESVLASALMVGNEPIRATAPDPYTVTLSFAAPSGPGLRLLDGLVILPKHTLAAALAAGTLSSAWPSSTPPSDIVGTGPFVVAAYQPGERMIFKRNPRYWRKAPDGAPLPYLDRLILEIVPDQNAELLRLQSGAIDLTQSELRPDDVMTVRRAEREGRLTLVELGVATDADAFWFCLAAKKLATDPRAAFVRRPEFRQALSHAVDREAFARTVYLGEAVPVWGPITPGNRLWFSPNIPRYPFDPAKAREMLAAIGLLDRDGNGVVEDAAGTEARFTVITQRGIGWYERGTTVLREAAARVGIALDIVPLEFNTMIQRMLRGEYDAMYYRPQSTSLDPAENMDMWLSSGSAHFWNLGERTPATDWERQIDTLMQEQASTIDPARRIAIFLDVQRIFAKQLPVLYFVAPRMYYAYNARLRGVVPSVIRPPVLWNADSLSVSSSASTGQ